MPVSRADAADWQRFESAYFVVDTSASERKTLAILRELELFRAAVLQVANLRVPESAPRTEVLIFGKRKDFEKFGLGRNVGGFAARHGDRFLIVMPASGSSDWSEQVIRHEFSHVLLGHSGFPFPMWYSEGFAELMSTIDIREKKLTFALGEPPEAAQWISGDSYNWNALIGEGWDRESLHANIVSSAYLQSWLLVHYAMLGEDFSNMPKLYEYFRLIGSGMESLPAFEQAFGMNGQALWAQKLRHYSKRLFYLIYDFRPDDLHLDFRRTEADVEAIEALIVELSR